MPLIHDPMMFALAVAALIIVLWTASSALGPRGRALRVAARPMMTPNEWEFYGRLRTALPDHVVCPQVAMSAVVTHAAGLSPTHRLATRNRFDRKVCDFVVLGGDGKTVAIVELDDRSHSRAKDAARDAITGAAGYRTVRFPSRPRPTAAAIRAAVVQ